MKVLLIDDDAEVSKYIEVALSKFDNIVFKSRNSAESGLALLKSEPFDILLMDIMMPGINGIEASKAIRNQDSKIGILFISNQHELDVKSNAFNAGGDDYLVKPFHPEELTMRLFALFKRVNSESYISKVNVNKVNYQLGECLFNLDERKFTKKDGSVIKLSTKEAEVLLGLVECVNSVTKRRDLLINIWGRTDLYANNLLDVYINRIRKLLKEESSIMIESIHGTGFKLICSSFSEV